MLNKRKETINEASQSRQVVKDNLIQLLEWIEDNNDKFDYKHFSFCYEMNLFEIVIGIRREFSIYNFISNPGWFTGDFDEDEKSFEINEQIKDDDGLKTKMKIVFDLSHNADVKQKLVNLEAISNQFRYEQQPLAPVVTKAQWKTYLNLINSGIYRKNIIILDCDPNCLNRKIIDHLDILNKFETIAKIKS